MKVKSNHAGLLAAIIYASLLTACSATNPAISQSSEPPLNNSLELPGPEVINAGESREEAAPKTEEVLESFDQLGISLEIPSNLILTKDPIVNFDDSSILDSYLFYIENDRETRETISDYFQMYGHLQYNHPKISWEDFADIHANSPMYSYANEIEINGLRGFDAQFTGERNRFVYQFYLDGHTLSIAVAQPTEENKMLSDRIIQTIRYDPSGFTSRSNVQRIDDANSLFQVFIPEDWVFAFRPAIEIRLADFSASSSDWEIVTEESSGPHANVFFNSGVSMSLVVLDDETAKFEPIMADIRMESPVTINGIEGREYTYVEPSTMTGEIREFRFFHNDLSYLLRFSYAPNTDQQTLDWIVRNLMLPQFE